MSKSPFESWPPERLPQRRRRAVGLGALALVVIAAAGFVYLRSTQTPMPITNSLVIRPLLVTNDLVNYNFISPSTGWALDFSENRPQPVAGRFWILRTDDGGKHWQKQLTGENGFGSVSSDSIQFFDKAHGFVFVRGSPNHLFRTDDGGAKWQLLDLPAPASGAINFDATTFSDPTNGWILFRTGSLAHQVLTVYATRDAGNTWEQLPEPPAGASGLSFRSPGEGWMGSGDINVPHVYTSTDAGQTWQRKDLPPPPGQLWNASLYFPASVELLPGRGVVAFISTEFQPGNAALTFSFTSMDQGVTWRYSRPPPGVVAYQDALHWWAMNGSFLFKSSDAGQTWTTAADALPVWQYIPHVLDSKHAWALLSVAGGYGLALTDDGGLHWTRANVPQPD